MVGREQDERLVEQVGVGQRLPDSPDAAVGRRRDQRVQLRDVLPDAVRVGKEPKRFDSGTVTENVSLYDLYATFCDCCDLPVSPDLDSRSLVPLLKGDTDEWHDRYDDEIVSQGADNDSIVEGVDNEKLLVKRGDLRYCYYGEKHPEVLFDLDRDPEESTNRATDSGYADAMATFRTRRGELGYGPDADPNYETAGYDPGVPVDER